VTIGDLETVWHLVAWCELRQDFWSFRTDRVTAAGFSTSATLSRVSCGQNCDAP
jgi:predicted DNA-binding transcriptional regulator YafY